MSELSEIKLCLQNVIQEVQALRGMIDALSKKVDSPLPSVVIDRSTMTPPQTRNSPTQTIKEYSCV